MSDATMTQAARATGGTSVGRAWAVARLSLANLGLAWTVTAVFFALVTVPSVIQIVQAGPDEYFEDSYLIGSGNACLLLLLVAPITVAAGHQAKVMHLNASKADFLAGSMLLYMILAAAVSAVNLAFYHTLDHSWAQTFQVLNLGEVFGWTGDDVAVGFARQFAFLTVLAVAVHTLASALRMWAGWAALLALIALFGASLVVEPLVDARGRLFEMLLFHPHALVQIGSCLATAALLYGVALAVLRRREL
ncbi:hypothetical protein [Glycomyces tenuis]|uniref:hypothetical protein n=1 Tax=Glycomyces tenuis TaxID=58116 RepID=UPI00041C09EE|nr:hypothetical protein [Glycomyces tenuis]